MRITNFFRCGEPRYRGRQDVVIANFNFFENAGINPRQGPQSGAAILVHQGNQRPACGVKLPGTFAFEAHQINDVGAPAVFIQVPAQIFAVHLKPREILFRKVNPADLVIFAQVAKNIGELKRDPQTFRPAPAPEDR